MDNTTDIATLKKIVSMAVEARGHEVRSIRIAFDGALVQAFSVKSVPGTLGHPVVIAELRDNGEGQFVFSVEE